MHKLRKPRCNTLKAQNFFLWGYQPWQAHTAGTKAPGELLYFAHVAVFVLGPVANGGTTARLADAARADEEVRGLRAALLGTAGLR